MFTGWTPIDPILSIVVSLLVLRSGWMLIKESGHELLEGRRRILMWLSYSVRWRAASRRCVTCIMCICGRWARSR